MKFATAPLSLLFFLLIFVCTGPGTAAAEDELTFPLRAEYADLVPIETDDLAAVYDDAIVVDVRNKVEYDVVHMAGAVNILVGQMKEEDLTALRGKTDAAPLVFYCNGTTCSKSYKAAKKAVGWGFTNVKVYDAGVFHWAQKHPERSLFFNTKLTADTVATSFISKDEFNAASLSTADFLAKSQDKAFTVIDIRDPNERKEMPIKLAGIKVMDMDILVNLLEKGSKAVPKSNLLILDNVGKQVDWIQYYLKKEGVTNYHFLKGGVRQWVKDGYDASGTK